MFSEGWGGVENRMETKLERERERQRGGSWDMRVVRGGIGFMPLGDFCVWGQGCVISVNFDFRYFYLLVQIYIYIIVGS